VSKTGRVLIAMLVLTGGLLCAAAQTPEVDPGVLAKANAGDAAAQVQAGESCAAAHDFAQAVAWYTKAANQGSGKDSISGEIHLAALYRDGGKGFPRDMTQAAAWYRKAADQGDAAAQGTMGMLYMLGQGVERSDVEAYYWLDLAAAVQGPQQAQYAANRQAVGTRITADELADVEDRVAKWKAAHPRPDSGPDSGPDSAQ
jgi:TPR repeat protein